MVRGAIRAAASAPPAEWAVALLKRLDRSEAPVCVVLTYHRVLDPASHPTTYPGLCVRPGELEAQLRELVRHHEVIALSDLLAAQRGSARLPRRSVLLTFDDAYTDFGTNAWPILASMSLPAVLFVPTGFPGRSDRAFWWERLHELLVLAAPHGIVETPIGSLRVGGAAERSRTFRQLRSYAKGADEAAIEALLDRLESAIAAPPARGQTLSWDALRQLAGAGITLAPHSRSHRILPRLDDEELRRELEEPRTMLEREIGHSPAALAYPSGAEDARVRDAARAAGYEIGFTTQRGANLIGRRDWLALRRINVGLGTPPRLIGTQIGVLSTLGAIGR